MSEKHILKSTSPLIKDFPFLAAALGLVLAAVFAYSGHFNNPFHFDDAHTIQTNMAIRNIHNIPSFFKDATTTSSLPANQAYRPGVTTLNAIDFWLGGGAEPIPKYYHRSIFIAYLVLGFLLFLVVYALFNQAIVHRWNRWFALLSTGFYMLHTANAETVNYIISRTDLYSTLFILLAFVMYQYSAICRRFHLYLVAVLVGFFIKEPAIMFGPLLMVYAFLFEQKGDLTQAFRSPKKLWNAFLVGGIALVVGVALFVFSQKMTPHTFTSGGLDRWHYLATQSFVIVHYVNNFFFPFNLSADTDWTLIKNYFDDRIIIGTLFVIGMFLLAFFASRSAKYRPVAFGVLWFFIALAPTSSIFPWAEVLNDHRVFFPYIGLSIAVVWAMAVWVIDCEEQLEKSIFLKSLSIMLPLLLLSAHVMGVRARCKTWSSGELLWKDVTEKSPGNARGLMNYGNALMSKGDYPNALIYFEKAKALWPAYSYCYINIGVLKAAMKLPQEAETNYKYALQLNPDNPECHFFYGNFLLQNGRFNEAVGIVSQGLGISPNHIGLNKLQASLNSLPKGAATTKLDLAIAKTKANPTPENWLNVSLEYYLVADYQGCVTAAEEAIKLNPKFDLAYNNLCSAYNMLKEWDKGIAAGKMAVSLNPTSQLAKNNLAVSLKGKEGK